MIEIPIQWFDVALAPLFLAIRRAHTKTFGQVQRKAELNLAINPAMPFIPFMSIFLNKVLNFLFPST